MLVESRAATWQEVSLTFARQDYAKFEVGSRFPETATTVFIAVSRRPEREHPQRQAGQTMRCYRPRLKPCPVQSAGMPKGSGSLGCHRTHPAAPLPASYQVHNRQESSDSTCRGTGARPRQNLPMQQSLQHHVLRTPPVALHTRPTADRTSLTNGHDRSGRLECDRGHTLAT